MLTIEIDDLNPCQLKRLNTLSLPSIVCSISRLRVLLHWKWEPHFMSVAFGALCTTPSYHHFSHYTFGSLFWNSEMSSSSNRASLGCNFLFLFVRYWHGSLYRHRKIMTASSKLGGGYVLVQTMPSFPLKYRSTREIGTGMSQPVERCRVAQTCTDSRGKTSRYYLVLCVSYWSRCCR